MREEPNRDPRQAPALAPALIPALVPPAIVSPFEGVLFVELSVLLCAIPLAAVAIARAARRSPPPAPRPADPSPPRLSGAAPRESVPSPEVDRPATPQSPEEAGTPVSANHGLDHAADDEEAGTTAAREAARERIARGGMPPTSPPADIRVNAGAEPPPGVYSPVKPIPYETLMFYAGQRRLDAARGREAVRCALKPLAEAGFFAFEDVLTVEHGAIDQLVVGPTGVHPVLVMAHRGYVYREAEHNMLSWGRHKMDPEVPDNESRWWDGRWEEEPQLVMDHFRRDLAANVTREGVGVLPVFCFTEATLDKGPDGAHPHHTATPFELAAHLRDTDPEAYGYLRLDGHQVRDLVREVVKTYNRLPWLVPEGEELFAAGLKEEAL